MTPNIGPLDRTLRIILGLGLIAASLAGLIGPWGYIGIIPLVTAAVRFCPAYRLVGLNTCPLPRL